MEGDIFCDGFSDTHHPLLVEGGVVQGEKAHGEDFFYHDQVPEISLGKIFAGVTGAVRFDGVGVGFVLFISNIYFTALYK